MTFHSSPSNLTDSSRCILGGLGYFQVLLCDDFHHRVMPEATSSRLALWYMNHFWSRDLVTEHRHHYDSPDDNGGYEEERAHPNVSFPRVANWIITSSVSASPPTPAKYSSLAHMLAISLCRSGRTPPSRVIFSMAAITASSSTT